MSLNAIYLINGAVNSSESTVPKEWMAVNNKLLKVVNWSGGSLMKNKKKKNKRKQNKNSMTCEMDILLLLLQIPEHPKF
jgi:hypothetical protein